MRNWLYVLKFDLINDLLERLDHIRKKNNIKKLINHFLFMANSWGCNRSFKVVIKILHIQPFWIKCWIDNNLSTIDSEVNAQEKSQFLKFSLFCVVTKSFSKKHMVIQLNVSIMSKDSESANKYSSNFCSIYIYVEWDICIFIFLSILFFIWKANFLERKRPNSKYGKIFLKGTFFN